VTLLLLGGTAEARAIAAQLALQGVPTVASLAGVTREVEPYDVPMRIGGFGGDEGMMSYLQGAEIKSVLDATHPFALSITRRALRLCAQAGLPHALLDRPVWSPGAGDRWETVTSEAEAVAAIGPDARVLLAVGAQRLAAFAGLRAGAVFARQVDPPEAAEKLKNVQYIIGKPSQSEAGERGLFERLGVDTLVARNSGGARGRAKLDAARNLGMRVILITRPEPPEAAHRVSTVDEAVDWAVRQCG